MTDLREAAQQALEALEAVDNDAHGTSFPATVSGAITDLRAALAQQDEPSQSLPIRVTVLDDAHPNGIPLEQWVRSGNPPQRKTQTLDDAMQQPRAMAQAYEAGYKAGVAAERKRIIQFLQEMQRQVGDRHNYYGVAAMRIREME